MQLDEQGEYASLTVGDQLVRIQRNSELLKSNIDKDMKQLNRKYDNQKFQKQHQVMYEKVQSNLKEMNDDMVLFNIYKKYQQGMLKKAEESSKGKMNLANNRNTSHL